MNIGCSVTSGFKWNITGIPVEISHKIWWYYRWYTNAVSNISAITSGIPMVSNISAITSGIPMVSNISAITSGIPAVEYQWNTSDKFGGITSVIQRHNTTVLPLKSSV